MKRSIFSSIVIGTSLIIVALIVIAYLSFSQKTGNSAHRYVAYEDGYREIRIHFFHKNKFENDFVESFKLLKEKKIRDVFIPDSHFIILYFVIGKESYSFLYSPIFNDSDEWYKEIMDRDDSARQSFEFYKKWMNIFNSEFSFSEKDDFYYNY